MLHKQVFNTLGQSGISTAAGDERRERKVTLVSPIFVITHCYIILMSIRVFQKMY